MQLSDCSTLTADCFTIGMHTAMYSLSVVYLGRVDLFYLSLLFGQESGSEILSHFEQLAFVRFWFCCKSAFIRSYEGVASIRTVGFLSLNHSTACSSAFVFLQAQQKRFIVMQSYFEGYLSTCVSRLIRRDTVITLPAKNPEKAEMLINCHAHLGFYFGW